jgi:glycopeptide antibiotics resistance protein
MIPRFMYPLLPFRSIVEPFVVVSAIAVPCWLFVRLYRARRPGYHRSFRREIVLLTFVVYLSGVAAATLEPNRPSRSVAESMLGVQLRPDPASLTCSASTLPAGSAARAFCVRNARGNVALFVPLGLLLPLIRSGLRFRSGLLIALALSCGIELLQYVSRAWGSYRSVDVNDVILNVVGTGLGLALASLFRVLSGAPLRSRAAARAQGAGYRETQ